MSLSSHNHNSISFLKPFPMAQMPQKTFEKTLRTGSSPKKLAEAFTIETSKWPQNLESNRCSYYARRGGWKTSRKQIIKCDKASHAKSS